jgi:hypothetical protein
MSSKPSPSFTGAMHGMQTARLLDRSRTEHINERAQRFDEALRLMEQGCWRASFTHLAELADGGHPQAARIALLFAKRGSLLFGGSFHASAEQRAGWQRASDC